MLRSLPLELDDRRLLDTVSLLSSSSSSSSRLRFSLSRSGGVGKEEAVLEALVGASDSVEAAGGRISMSLACNSDSERSESSSSSG